MALQLVRLDAQPREIAVTKVGTIVDGGAFFLDFSRPLERLRWFGVQNSFIGPTVGLLIPVVHERERTGGFLVSAQRADPYFTDILALWKARFPRQRLPPTQVADSLKIVADFATQFPEDSK